MENKYVIGLDYGTDSARALVVNAHTGDVLASSVKYYPRWMKGLYCVPKANQWRQHPKDYLEVLEASVKEALAECSPEVAANVVGIAFDTTGSTPAFTDENGTPLAMLPEFEDNPNAMFVLWKDHTAIKEAAEINAKCKESDIDYSRYEGGIYSAEWFWAKAIHVLREAPEVAAKAYSIVEYCEWLPAVLTGVTKADGIVRSRCAEGHKAMWHESWGGLPPEEFLVKLDPSLAGFRERLFETTETADKPVGTLCPEWAERLGLSTDVVVAGGAFDCHMGAVGAAVTPNTLVRVIGTSTCDIMVASYEEVGIVYASMASVLDSSFDCAALAEEAAQRLKPLEEASNEFRFQAAAAASLHEFAKEVFEVWQNSGVFARRRALRELRVRAGFRLESHRIGNYVAKTFDLQNEAAERYAKAQQAIYKANAAYKVKPGTYALIAGRLSSFLSSDDGDA